MSDPLQTPSPAAMVASLSFIFCFIFPVVCFCVGYVRFRYLVSRMPQDESSTIRELEGYSWDVIRIQQNVERFNNMYSLKKKKKTILRILKKYRMVVTKDDLYDVEKSTQENKEAGRVSQHDGSNVNTASMDNNNSTFGSLCLILPIATGSKDRSDVEKGETTGQSNDDDEDTFVDCEKADNTNSDCQTSNYDFPSRIEKKLKSTTAAQTRVVGGTCAICLENYKVGDVVNWSPNPSCTHVFHEECIMKCFTTSGRSSCPVCRHCFLNNGGNYITSEQL